MPSTLKGRHYILFLEKLHQKLGVRVRSGDRYVFETNSGEMIWNSDTNIRYPQAEITVRIIDHYRYFDLSGANL